MNKRLCFVLELFFFECKGGSELQAYFIAQELLKRGWDVHYIREKEKTAAKEESSYGIVLHSIPQRHTKLKWLNIFRLYKVMRKIKADVWYCRGTISYVFPVWVNAKLLGGKVVWACSHDTQVSKSMKKEYKKENLIYKIFFHLDRFLFLAVLKKIDLIILQSYLQKSLLNSNWGLDAPVIYNGYHIPELKETRREPVVLWIGRLQTWKHPDRFIELADRLRNKPYNFFILGPPCEQGEYMERLKKADREIRQLKYLGERDRDEVLSLLSKAKLLVNTSDSEGFSNTFIEAWMSGVPVVSLKVDPDGMIENNRLGRLSLTLDQMAKDTEMLMENDSLWNEFSQRCRQFSEENFEIQNKVSSLEKLIARINKSDGK